MWMVTRIIVPRMTRLASRAPLSASRRKPRFRDHRAMYGDGAYCVWSPPIRSTTVVRGSRDLSRSSWRARSVRFSCRVVRTRSVPATSESRNRLEDDHGDLALRSLLVITEGGCDLRLAAPQPLAL